MQYLCAAKIKRVRMRLLTEAFTAFNLNVAHLHGIYCASQNEAAQATSAVRGLGNAQQFKPQENSKPLPRAA